MRNLLRSRAAFAIGGVVCGAVLVSGITAAVAETRTVDIRDSAGLLNVCVGTFGTNVRFVGGRTNCTDGEVHLGWNQAGATGAIGPTGPQGAAGASYLVNYNAAYINSDALTTPAFVANATTPVAVTLSTTTFTSPANGSMFEVGVYDTNVSPGPTSLNCVGGSTTNPLITLTVDGAAVGSGPYVFDAGVHTVTHTLTPGQCTGATTGDPNVTYTKRGITVRYLK